LQTQRSNRCRVEIDYFAMLTIIVDAGGCPYNEIDVPPALVFSAHNVYNTFRYSFLAERACCTCRKDELVLFVPAK